MTITKPIVIPRDQLPRVLVTFNVNSIFLYAEDSQQRWAVDKSSARTARQRAMEHLALAEALDSMLDAETKVEAEAAAKDEKNLNEEAQALSAAAGGRVILTAAQPWEVEYWRNVARAARELHGK